MTAKKRVALASALVFLAINGVKLAENDDFFEALTLSVARGEVGKEKVAERLRQADHA